MKNKLNEAKGRGFKDGVKTICLVSEKEATIIGSPYVFHTRIHAKTNDLASGYIVIYDGEKFSKLL